MRLLILATFTISLIMSSISAANEADEIATGTLSCKAEWNEFCEDQKIINVPEGHKLCNHIITVKEQSGNSAYALITTDSKSITVKFSARGNRDRFKQQSANIVLAVSLFGVRESSECPSAITAAPKEITAVAPQIIAPQQASPQVSAPQATAPPQNTTTTMSTAETKPKVDACACSQWIDAGKVTSCLEAGHGRDNAACDSYAATIQCVSSRDECRDIQKDDCYQVMSLNQTTSQKRIYIANSPYCQAQIKK